MRKLQSSTCRLAALTATGAALASVVAHAQTPAVAPSAAVTSPGLIAHATREVQATDVASIAAFAQPLRFDASSFPGLEGLTAREAVRRICGSEQDGYWDLVRGSNPQLDLQPDSALGNKAYEVRWPACLHIQADNELYRVKPGDTPIGLSSLISGIRLGAEAKKLFGLARGQTLMAGETIRLPFKAVPTSFVAKPGSGKQLLAALRRTSEVKSATDPGAEIIVPVEVDAQLGIASTDQTACTPGPANAYPFSPPGVAKAYDITRQLWEENYARRTVYVVVADNGFFGVPCSPGNCPERNAGDLKYADRFPAWFFDSTHFPPNVLGPLHATNLKPINYENQPWSNIDWVAGHGTHVAGLILGGPSFAAHRSVFSSTPGPFSSVGRPSWLKMVISNLSGGKREVPPGAEHWLFQDVAGFAGTKIVNMSIIMSAAQRPNIDQVLKGNIESDEQRDTLFVAAAGNRMGDLSGRRLYPAMLGAMNNLVVVAASDGSGALANFTNYGKQFVDMAAPGCKVPSWLTAEQNPEFVSGSSQAAPIVTFTAALLRSVWDKPPVSVKSRLIASGNLLRDSASRGRLRYPVELSIPKALLVKHHVVTFARNGVQRTVIGRLSDLQGFRCLDGTPLGQAELLSYKIDAAPGTIFYRTDPSSLVAICDGTLDSEIGDGSPNVVTFDVEFELEADVPVERAARWNIAANEIVDIVYPD